MENSKTTLKRVKRSGEIAIRNFPLHSMVSHFEFEENQIEEAHLCDAIAHVAVKNGLSNNDVMHLFPVIMRILKDKSAWGS